MLCPCNSFYTIMSTTDKTFSQLSDDVILKILFLLEDDPRSWARLSCVSNKFSNLISAVCCKSKCISTLPSLSTSLLSSPSHGGAWASLYKIAVCCPGLHHSGVLLDHSDFGLLRDLGPHEDYPRVNQGHACNISMSDSKTVLSQTCNNVNDNMLSDPKEGHACSTSQIDPDLRVNQGHACTTLVNRLPDLKINQGQGQTTINVPDSRNNQSQSQTRILCDPGLETWTLFDDLYLDSLYDTSETTTATVDAHRESTSAVVSDTNFIISNENETKRRKTSSSASSSPASSRLVRSHLASGTRNLSREQGNKLLASRFRDDRLYISDWPGCIHMEEKRNYMVFRGVFQNFKRSKVWRTIKEGQKSHLELNCAYCECKYTWDLHSAFCLKRGFGFHDDGEPVVRAYVCDNGHVSGAWTDLPLYG